MALKRFYGKGLPGVEARELRGKLIVVEGSDGAGRSTQILLLRDWLQANGYPTAETGLKRSRLVGAELEEAMQGNTLCPVTLSLFYATDFADQLEHNLVPALRAGFIVIADRYMYSLIARHAVRGGDAPWLREVFGLAVIPDLVLYLKVSPRSLAERTLQKSGTLGFWESGADIQRSGDLYQSFIRYQRQINRVFESMVLEYGMEVINGEGDTLETHRAIRQHMERLVRTRRTSLTTARQS